MAGVMDNFALSLKLNATLSKALDLGTPIDYVSLNESITMSNGTSTGQVSQMWHDRRTLAASASENLDLAGVLTNAFGVTLTFTSIKFIYVKASAANNAANPVHVIRHTSAGAPLFLAALDGIALLPGAIFMYVSPTTGVTVTATTADMITITNGAGTNSVDYDIVIVGTD